MVPEGRRDVSFMNDRENHGERNELKDMKKTKDMMLRLGLIETTGHLAMAVCMGIFKCYFSREHIALSQKWVCRQINNKSKQCTYVQ